MTPLSDAALRMLMRWAEKGSPCCMHPVDALAAFTELQQARLLARKVRTHLCPHFDGSDCPYILARQIGGAQ